MRVRRFLAALLDWVIGLAIRARIALFPPPVVLLDEMDADMRYRLSSDEMFERAWRRVAARTSGRPVSLGRRNA